MLLNFKPSEEISLAQLEIDASVVEMESISSEPTQHLNDGLFLQEGMFENPNELDIDWNIWHSLIEEASFDEAFQGIISNHSEFDDDPQYRDTHFPSN
ncbi:uncharacterized protein EAE98_005604 [Botrytis deweyae]|uniref:Uncharacterized protein n=1 Tax=Botrytis deweyae TaxID=2478750 RepID=A0ABQ7IM91_9HELO|nr:uncharacterized protein EAE98_005604 [Botrytis deweyae]KAF7928548.1 hypothetical protein EAE98_005604 [Botrytis deweyae]